MVKIDMRKLLPQMIDRFFREFPGLRANTHILNPFEPDCDHKAHRWAGQKMRDADLDGRTMQNAWTGIHRHITGGSPHFFGIVGNRNQGIVAGLVNPVSVKQSWSERAQRFLAGQAEQDWAKPDLKPYTRLNTAYQIYTFHHETGHAVQHSLPRSLSTASVGASKAQYDLDAKVQKGEAFADIRGGLGLLRDLSAPDAVETMRHLAHLRSLTAIHQSDTEHLTTRAFNAVLAGVAGRRSLDAWQREGQAGAMALWNDLPEIAFTADEFEALANMKRAITPGDTYSPARALSAVSGIGESTHAPIVYELARDYVEAFAAIIPAERYEQTDLVKARLRLRRNPIAQSVDAAHPRVETMATQAKQALARKQRLAAKNTNTARPSRRSGP